MNRNDAQWRRAEQVLLGLLAFALLWRGIIPAWRTLNTDFPNYYMVARLLREGYSLDRVYDWVWLQRVKDHWGVTQPLVTFAGLTPFSALPVLPLTLWSALTAKRLWVLLNLIFLGASAEMLARETELGRRRTWLLCLLAIVPLETSFLDGQMHLLVLLLMVMAYRFQRSGRRGACGVCLGLAGALKVYPLLFGLYFLWKRRWREVLVITGTVAAALLICEMWMGGHVLHVYVTQQLPRSMQGETLDPYHARAASGAALFHRLFIFEPEMNPAPLLRSPMLYAVLYPLWQAVMLLQIFAAIRMSPEYADHDEEKLEWAAMPMVLLLLSTVPSSYHFVALIAGVVWCADVLLRRGQVRELAVLVGIFALIGVVDLSPVQLTHTISAWNALAFARLWLMTALWAGCVTYLWRERGVLQAMKAEWRRAVLVAAPFALLWVAGVVGYQRHFAGMETDAARRFSLPASTLLATRPMVLRGGFLYTAIAGAGYDVLDQNGRGILAEEQKAGGEALSATTHGALTLAEVANSKGSPLVQASTSETPMALHVEDAETPVFAPDGSSLAYIHEVRGRGSLWVVQMQGATPSSLLEAVSSPSDVRDVTYLSPSVLLFTAKEKGKTKIFAMPANRSSEPVVFFEGKSDVDSPAVSPDGKMVAFRMLVHDRWQLMVMDVKLKQPRQMTAGDCYAYTPAWLDRRRVIYATDCGRGIGLTALATVDVTR